MSGETQKEIQNNDKHYQIENARKRKEARYIENHGSLEGFTTKSYKKKLHKNNVKPKK